MSEPIKQTLFAFSATRAPELLSEEAEANYFIKHFDGTTGVFYTAVAGMGAGDVRRTVLETAAQSFSALDLAGIIATDPDLYDLGKMLVKNRKTITVAEATSAVSGLSALSSGKKETVWDNLFYQLITMESSYVREIAILLLTADHFVSNFGSIPTTDEDMQKWASSKVVIPKSLFGVEDVYADNASFSEGVDGLEILFGEIESYESKLDIEALNTLKAEITTYKLDFLKTTNAAEAAALDTHLANVKTALDGATKTATIDQFSSYEFDVYSNLTMPTLSYSRPSDIQKSAITQEISTISSYTADSSGLFDSESFDEFEARIEELRLEKENNIFQKVSFNQDQVAIDGSIISKCFISQKLRKQFSFILKLYQRTASDYSLLLGVITDYDCSKVQEISTTIDVPSSTTIKTRSGLSSNGVLVVDLTKDSLIDMSQNQSLNVSLSIKLNNGLELSLDTTSLSIGDMLTGVLSYSSTSGNGSELHVPSGYGITRLGVSDYKKVEQTLCCYVAGEVSHIENIMAREFKDRSTRRLRRSEDTVTTSTVTESEQMTDTTSTSRFDMQREVSQVISESNSSDRTIGMNSNVSGKTKVPLIGEVDFSIGGNMSNSFSTTNSTEDSNSQAVNISKDITEKALNRMVTKVSEERVNKIVEEFEENNRHGFDNRKGAEHISGVFRWVDKVYKNQIHNYGKRLQYEFMIPEPAEFHLLSKTSQASSISSTPLMKPLDPRSNSFGVLEPIRNSAHILETNYHQWAAAYGATVMPPPKSHLTVGATLSRPEDGSAWYEGKSVKGSISVPDGYSVETVFVSQAASDDAAWNYIDVTAAGISKRFYEDIIDLWWFADSTAFPYLKFVHGSLPVAAHFLGHQSGSVTFTVRLARKWETFKEWQLDTFNAIMSAYEKKLAEYESKLAELETKQGLITAENPAFYRQIENTVLKKNCITYLTGFDYMGQNHTSGMNVSNQQIMQTEAMDKYAATVKFFEQAFEWNIMSYNFYPFYWANKDRWQELYTIDNEDPLFKSFLSAGMARVHVTVRPGFERSVMNYLATGLVWDGGEPPVVDDPQFLSIIEELEDPEYTLEETWETRVPSTLTVIQAKTIALDADGLPCYCDSETPPNETIVVPDPNPLTGLDVHIDGETTV